MLTSFFFLHLNHVVLIVRAQNRFFSCCVKSILPGVSLKNLLIQYTRNWENMFSHSNSCGNICFLYYEGHRGHSFTVGGIVRRTAITWWQNVRSTSGLRWHKDYLMFVMVMYYYANYLICITLKINEECEKFEMYEILPRFSPTVGQLGSGTPSFFYLNI